MYDFELSATTVNHFRQLPLERVEISSAFADCHRLTSTLPNVERLSMDSQLVYYEDLVLISKAMPKLQYLFAYLVLTGWPSDLPRNSSSPLSCHIDSQFVFEEEIDLGRP